MSDTYQLSVTFRWDSDPIQPHCTLANTGPLVLMDGVPWLRAHYQNADGMILCVRVSDGLVAYRPPDTGTRQPDFIEEVYGQ